MPAGFDALGERDPDSPESDYTEMLAAKGNHSEALVKLGAVLAYCPVEPERNLEAAASYLALEILNDPKRSLQWLQSLSRALMKPH